MFQTCTCGVVLPMWMYRRTGVVRWDHLWRNAFFLAILQVTRTGSSTTQTLSASSFLNALCLTNTTFLVRKIGSQSLSIALSHPAHPLTLLSTPPLDDDPLLAVPELPLPHLEGEEPAPGHADVPALLAVSEQVQADLLVTLPAPATTEASFCDIPRAAQPASRSHPPPAPCSTPSELAHTPPRVQFFTTRSIAGDTA
jgi:hypothetical protein